MIHGAENKGHIKGVIVKQTKVRSIALIGTDQIKPAAIFSKSGKVAFNKFHRGHIETFFSQRNGIPTSPRADLQNPGSGVQKAVDEGHRDRVLELTVPAFLQPAVLVAPVVELGYHFFSRAHTFLSMKRGCCYVSADHLFKLILRDDGDAERTRLVQLAPGALPREDVRCLFGDRG